jgi:hypothetical protein
MKALDEIQQYRTFVTAEVLFLLDYIAPDFVSKKISDLACECYDRLPAKITLSIQENEQ